MLFTIALGRAGTSELAVLDLRTGKTSVLMRGAEAAQYVDTGHVVFAASGTLFAVGFDLERLELRGEPASLLPGGLQVHAVGYPKYTVSRAGMLAFLPPQVPARSLVWVDRQGHETATGAPTRSYITLTLSPDGRRAAVASVDEERDVWVWDFAAKTMRRLTFDPSTDWVPIWTPDGRWIVFRSNRAGRNNLYRQASDGSGSVERLTTSDNEPYPNAVARTASTSWARNCCRRRLSTSSDILPSLTVPRVPINRGWQTRQRLVELRSSRAPRRSTPRALSATGRRVACSPRGTRVTSFRTTSRQMASAF